VTAKIVQRAGDAGLQLGILQLFQYQTIAEIARVVVPPKELGHAVDALDRKPLSPVHEPMAVKAHRPVRVTVESLRAFGQEALQRAGLRKDGAAVVTDVQLEASLRGQPTHNVGAIPRYARRIASGRINPQPQLKIVRETPISALIDGDNAPGQWVGVFAMETAIRKAREHGIGVVGARRSNHLGAAGHYAWLAAKENLIGLCTTNAILWLAPTGSLTPTFGNNPLGVAIPALRRHPILLDISMSTAAKGKIGLHLAEGKALPQGWIFDRAGRLSSDAFDLAAGLGVPIGGHKGYGLTLVMETLAGLLTGAGFCRDHRPERIRHGPERFSFPANRRCAPASETCARACPCCLPPGACF
jgi:LDH2 family malate/lactate/ureidoglycolate dehydrogenase